MGTGRQRPMDHTRQPCSGTMAPSKSSTSTFSRSRSRTGVWCAACVANVTEQRRSQEQIAYQATLLANVNDAVIAVDVNGVITAWNRAAIEIFGWTAEEAIGRRADEVLRPQYPGGDFAQALAESGRYRGELIQHHKDGRAIPIEITMMALVGDEGQVTGTVSVNREHQRAPAGAAEAGPTEPAPASPA